MLQSRFWHPIKHEINWGQRVYDYPVTLIFVLLFPLIARFMGPTWGRQDPGGLHVGPMKFATWDVFVHYPNFRRFLKVPPPPPHPHTHTHTHTHTQTSDRNQWRVALVFSLFLVWTSWQTNHGAADTYCRFRTRLTFLTAPFEHWIT